MAVRFLFGRAGSGKTYHCLQAIRKQLLADPVREPTLILFTPEQAAVQAERMLLSAKGLEGASRYYTMSFRRLQQMVLSHTGFAGRELVGPVGRQMILQYLLVHNRRDLQVLSKVADRPGTASKVADSIVEFMEEGLLPAHLASMARYVQDAGRQDALAGRIPGTLLVGKLHDLGLIYEAYLKWLTDRQQADPAGLLAESADRLEQCEWLRGSQVWVDGFATFSSQQRYALSRLARIARQVDIALLMDPELVVGEQPVQPYDLFYRTWQTHQQLRQSFVEAGVEIEEPLLLRASTPERFRHRPVLGRIESQLFATERAAAPVKTKAPPEIEIVAAPTRRAEVEAVARRIVDLTRVNSQSKALRYRQIAVLVRDLQPYHDFIETVFAAHNVPCFIDKRRGVSHHPLVELVRALLRLIVNDWSIDAVAALLKTGLVPIPRDRADLVENYLLAHGIAGQENWCGKDWEYVRRFVGADEEPEPLSDQERHILRKANYARRMLCRALGEWTTAATGAQGPRPRESTGVARAATRTGRAWAEHLYATLEHLKVPQRLMRWQNLARIHGGAAGLEQGQQHKQVWSLLTQLLDDLVAGLADQEMTIEEFQATIEAGLEAFSLPLIPPVVDQVVVGSVDRSRQPEIAAAFVLGFNEGLFPLRTGQDVLLCDQERDLLKELEGRVTGVGHRDTGNEQRVTEVGRQHPRARIELMTGKQRLFDERLLAYIALTRASRSVWLSYALADESGKTLSPSPYLRALQAVVPELAVRALEDPLACLRVNEVGTAWQAATGVVLRGKTSVAGGQSAKTETTADSDQREICGMRETLPLERTRADAPGYKGSGNDNGPPQGGTPNDDQRDASTSCTDEWVALGRWMNGQLEFAQKLRRVASACDYTNSCTVRAGQAKTLFADRPAYSVSQMQEYAVCPYRYFVHYALRLKERPEFELAAVELGSFYHRILYKLALGVRKQGHSLRTVPHEVLNELLNRTTDEELRAVVEELALSGGRQEYVLQRAKVDIGSAMRGHLALWKRSGFEPAMLEAGFGVGQGMPALTLTTPKGRSAILRGKIDRIDVASIGKTSALAVIDYKRSSKYKLRLDDAMAGLQVQLIVYMKAAMDAAGKGGLGGGAAVPGGMYYLNLLPTWQKVMPGELIDPAKGYDARQWQLKGFTNSDCLPAFHVDDADDRTWPVDVRLTSKGEPYANTPAAGTADFEKIINHVWQGLGKTLDRILDGEFPVQPYKAGKEMPCVYCPFDAVCRYSPDFNAYRTVNRTGNIRQCLEVIRGDLQ